MSAYLTLGKNGDLVSLLPILSHEFQTTGVKPTLVVSKIYRAIPEALDYVNTVIFDGDHQDLEGAIKFTKSQFDDVRITQLHGKGFQFQHRHPSFQYDQWDRAGALDKWDIFALNLPRKATTLKIPSNPFILYGDHSQSSPFWDKELLADDLKQHFPQHLIVRLSSVRASHPLELLALMDAADLIVSVDSMPLHLSKACQTPVIALVSDNPSRWQGSAWSSRFALHVRYSEFQKRRQEVIRAAQRAITGTILKSTPILDALGGYNPSIIRYGNQALTTFRYHPARSWKTRLAINDGLTSSDIIFPAELDEYSKEDARLFTHQGKLMLTYVLAKELPVSRQFRCVIGYGMLVQREGRWRVDKHIQPMFRGNDWMTIQKNWTPFEHDGKIHFIFGNHFGEQIVIQVDGEKVTQEFKSPESKWDYGEIRGGAIIPHGDNLLRFFHSRSGGAHWAARSGFCYHIGALLMESKPPFSVIKVCSHPILSGDERYVPGCFHWKQSVAIPYGVVADGPDYLLSIGRNDSSSHLVRLRYEDLGLT